MMRKLSAEENNVLLKMAGAVGSDLDRDQLVSDIHNCMVEDMVQDKSMIRFQIDGYERPSFSGQDTFRGKDGFPVEGLVKDVDGNDVDVFIFSDKNNRILEFELVKPTGEYIISIDWSSFYLK